MSRSGMPPFRRMAPWILGWGGLELAVAGLTGGGMTSLAAPVTGAWPLEERFFGTVDTLARHPDLVRAGVVLPGLGALLVAALSPLVATSFLARLGGVRPGGWTIAAIYLQAAWHGAMLGAGMVAARLFLGAWVPWLGMALVGGLLAAIATVAHDFTRCRVVAGVVAPAHPRWAVAGYRDAWLLPGTTLPALLLRLAQGALALGMVIASLHGLGDPGWRWLTRACGIFGVTLGFGRMAWVQRGAASDSAAAAVTPDSCEPKSASLGHRV